MKTESIKADRDDEQGQPHDGGTRRDGVRRQTADPTDILAAYSHRSGRSSTEHPFSRDLQGKNVYLDAGAPGETVSGAWGLSGLHRAKISTVSGEKRHSGGQQAALAGVRRAKSPYFAHSKAGLGGICRENSR